MLIGLWGSEPQQINFSERIMAQADIKHPPTPNTHFHLTTHKGRGEGERKSSEEGERVEDKV